MSKNQRMEIISIIEQADLLLMSMKGQMQITRDYAERNGGDVEFNDGLHIAVIIQAMVDTIRALLDEAATCAMNERPCEEAKA